MLIFFRKSLELENIIRNWQVAWDINGPLRSRKVFFTHRLVTRLHNHIYGSQISFSPHSEWINEFDVRIYGLIDKIIEQ